MSGKEVANVNDGDQQERAERSSHMEMKSETKRKRKKVKKSDVLWFSASKDVSVLKLATMLDVVQDNLDHAAVKKIDPASVKIAQIRLRLEELSRCVRRYEMDAYDSMRRHTQKVVYHALKFTMQYRNGNVLPQKGDDEYGDYTEAVDELVALIANLSREWEECAAEMAADPLEEMIR